MTIFRCEIAQAMLRDVVAEWTSWPGELHTITGYTLDEYQALGRRLDAKPRTMDQTDEAMLRQAAIQFFGYPNMTTRNVERLLSPDWPEALRSAFLEREK